MSVAARVRMAGPLTRYVDGFAAELTAHGYTDLSLANQLRLMADLSRWLQAAKTPVDGIDHDVVARFLVQRRHTRTGLISKRALAPLLRYLEAVGAVSMVAPDRRPDGELLREYERYLVEERAVLPARRDLCLAVATEFLDGKRAGALKAKDVTRFVDAQSGRPGLSGALSALRSVLRFLFVTSKTAPQPALATEAGFPPAAGTTYCICPVTEAYTAGTTLWRGSSGGSAAGPR